MEVVELPDGATPFLTSPFCPNAGFTIGTRAMTIQAHPEFTTEVSAALLDLRRPLLGDDILAETPLAGGFGGVEAIGRFEPLAAIVDQRDKRDRRIEQVRDELRHTVESRLGGGIHQSVFAKGFQPPRLARHRVAFAAVRQDPPLRCL